MIRALAVSALFFVSPALVCATNHSQDPAAPASQKQSPAPAAPPAEAPKTPKPKPKKVWTDENLGDVGGTISVVGDPQSASKTQSAQPRQSKPAPGKSSGDVVDPQTLATLRQQLQKLESDLAAADQQLAQLKGFSKGDSKNAGGLQSDTFQYNSSSVEEQIGHLQDKRTKIQGIIDSLLDAARASGIEPGQLR